MRKEDDAYGLGRNECEFQLWMQDVIGYGQSIEEVHQVGIELSGPFISVVFQQLCVVIC